MCQDNCKEGISMFKKTDVLIIGSGIAALQTAKTLCEHFQVHIVTKSSVYTSSSYRAQGGIAAVVSAEDDVNIHIKDTLQAGAEHHATHNVETLVQKGAQLITHLLNEGLPIDRKSDGLPQLGLEGAHSKHRILHAGGDQTGKVFVHYLLDRLGKEVTISENETAYELILNSANECIGAKTWKNGQSITYFAHHVVLATGGAAALYDATSNYQVNIGDGIALAYRAGAEISDMEFMQFHPTLLWCDGEAKGLISEAVRGAGAVFVDATGRPIMPGRDLAPRHVTAHALFEKRRAGINTYLNISMIEHFKEKFPSISQLCEKHHIALEKGFIPFAPGSHFLMGGVIANTTGETTIPSLYAIGEVACTGVHGANRLASNSLLEAMTFGEEMAGHIINKGLHQRNFLRKESEPKREITLPFSKEELKQQMMLSLGIIRERKQMAKFSSHLPLMADLYNANIAKMTLEQYELYTMHLVAALMASAAMARTETRGAHIRSDYPETVETWAERWIILKKGQLEVRNHLYEHTEIRRDIETIF